MSVEPNSFKSWEKKHIWNDDHKMAPTIWVIPGYQVPPQLPIPIISQPDLTCIFTDRKPWSIALKRQSLILGLMKINISWIKNKVTKNAHQTTLCSHLHATSIVLTQHLWHLLFISPSLLSPENTMPVELLASVISSSIPAPYTSKLLCPCLIRLVSLGFHLGAKTRISDEYFQPEKHICFSLDVPTCFFKC